MTTRTVLLSLLLSLLVPFGAGAAAADSEELLVQLMEVWRSGNVARLEGLLDAKAVYDDVPNGRKLIGREAIGDYLAGVHAWASEVTLEIESITAGADSAAAQWTFAATQDRPIPGRLPFATDRRVSLRGVTLIRTSNGRITYAADYLDLAAFVVQLGGAVTLPEHEPRPAADR